MQASEKVLCLRCGERSKAEAEVGDFPGRCPACGALTPPREGPNGRAVTRPLEQVPGNTGTIKRGALAAILSTRPPVEKRPATAGTDRTAAPADGGGGGQTADIRRALVSVQLHHKAVRRAELRGSYQALGVLGAAVLGLAMLLAISAFVLNVRSAKTHELPARVDAAGNPSQ